jgi:hypothetical protein
MKHSIVRSGLAVAFAVAMMAALVAPAHAWDRPCSLASVAGNWAFTDTGTVISVGPRTAVGVFTLDGNGHLLNGIATSSLNGTINDETFSGTYTVSSNCAGTLTAYIYISGALAYTVTINLAFDQNTEHMRGLFTSAVEPDGTSLQTVIGLDAREINPRTDTLSITDNAPDSAQTTGSSGTGTVVNFNPTSLNFGIIHERRSVTQTITLTNTGSTSLNITGITIAGSTYFHETNNCASSVGPGNSCTFSVSFYPVQTGTFTADLFVSDNGGGSPQEVALWGAYFYA